MAKTHKAWVMSLWSLLLVVPFLLLRYNLWHNDHDSTRPNSRSTIAYERGFREDLVGDTNNTSAHLLNRRDDYACSVSKPCANGACCGGSGYCGYGATYCGTGCVSNCNAHAECGKDAVPAGKTCPLNTCCSQYGFCGTTTDFCTTKCQSNCVEHPAPPSGGASNGALSKVIGYYESWADRLSCHRVGPGDLPLDSLTHLNYAFAYIDPASFEVVTMDQDTPGQLFASTTQVKQFSPGLQVWISIGGWTFSDNGTATQPVFSNIASSVANRQKFANNLLRFINNYGFDGVDIDWEYPGAPDRGGKPDDTKNFVALLQTIRTTFNSSPKKLGISFTAPSSYWYLKWFDLPGLLKSADWINLMTYDLHGVWDRNNPIGSIVQGHTNLSEIRLAADLLWRVNVPPSKVVMGHGFYGRSFQLASTSCTTPGCLFSGGAAPGPCSATSGILMYYEIMALLKQHPDLKPVWDKMAAVKYLVYNGNQWISYDDADTFKQKIAWANSVGIGGSLIWAADTDDDKYSAMSSLVGKQSNHIDLSRKAFQSSTNTIAQNLAGQNGQDCKYIDQCQDPNTATCESGWTKIGWDHDMSDGSTPCKNPKFGRIICCPSATSPDPNKCTWRGGGLDCDGQCHTGEATLTISRHGGGFNSQSGGPHRCNRGVQAFCCEATDWKQTISGCDWKCSCASGEKSVSTAYSLDGLWKCHPGKINYCCPINTPLNSCVWRGSLNDCADARCVLGEVAIAVDASGDLDPDGPNYACSWYRKRTDCCKVSVPPAAALQCSKTLCDLDPGFCIDDDGQQTLSKRAVTFAELVGDEEESLNSLVKRAGKRSFAWYLAGLGVPMVMESRPYVDADFVRRALRNGLQGFLQRWYPLPGSRCGSPSLGARPFPNNDMPAGGQIEHALPLMIISRFGRTVNYGRLPSQAPRGGPQQGAPGGPATRNAAIPSSWWQNVWNNAQGVPAGLRRYPSASPDLRLPWQRVYEALGSTTNTLSFTVLQDAVNAAKGRIEDFVAPMAASRVQGYARLAARGDSSAFDAMMAPLRETIGMFQYVRADDVTTRIDTIAANVYQTLLTIENNTQGGTGLAAHWNEFYPYYLSQVSDFARTYLTDRIAAIRREIRAAPSLPIHESMENELLSIENQIANCRYRQEP